MRECLRSCELVSPSRNKAHSGIWRRTHTKKLSVRCPACLFCLVLPSGEVRIKWFRHHCGHDPAHDHGAVFPISWHARALIKDMMDNNYSDRAIMDAVERFKSVSTLPAGYAPSALFKDRDAMICMRDIGNIRRRWSNKNMYGLVHLLDTSITIRVVHTRVHRCLFVCLSQIRAAAYGVGPMGSRHTGATQASQYALPHTTAQATNPQHRNGRRPAPTRQQRHIHARDAGTRCTPTSHRAHTTTCEGRA